MSTQTTSIAEQLKQAILSTVQVMCKTGHAREMRLRTGLSIRDLADLVGVPVGQLSGWETGRRLPTWGQGVWAYCDWLNRATLDLAAEDDSDA